MLFLPPDFVEATVRREGSRGEQWIRALPSTVDRLLEAWRLTVEGPVLSGYVALILFVRRPDAEPAVLKVGWIDDETRHEHRALSWWAGEGAVSLLASDTDHGAMLLERLDENRSLDDVGEIEALTVAAGLLRRLHVPPPPGLPALHDVAARWQDELPREWRDLGRPASSQLVDAATASCRELTASPGPSVLLHGDLHYRNVLARPGRGWAAIDPKPLSGDGEFDLLPLLRNRWEEITRTGAISRAVRRRLSLLCDQGDLDEERARRWCQARAVDDALWGLQHGEDGFAEIGWAIAEALAHE